MCSVKPPEKTPLLRESTGGIIILAVFIASRLIFSFMGGAFIAKPLAFAMQYLDPVLLKDDLLQSLFYLHSQPPLVQPHARPGAENVSNSGPVILNSF